MFSKSRSGLIGVDLGARVAKLAQLERVGSGLCLSAAAAVPRGGDQALRDDLRSLRAIAPRLRGAAAAATLSMNACTLEALGDDDQRPAGDCRGAWRPTPGSVYELSADAAFVEATVDGFAQVGLCCAAIDGAPTALARATEFLADAEPGRLIAVLDWGETSVLLVGAVDGQAVYARSLAAEGFEGARRAVAERLDFTADEAESVLAAPPREPSERRLLDQAVREATRPVVDELRRSLDHLGGKLRRPTPDRLHVTGSGSACPPCVERLGEALGLDTTPYRADRLEHGCGDSAPPDSLLPQALALSAFAWEEGA